MRCSRFLHTLEHLTLGNPPPAVKKNGGHARSLNVFPHVFFMLLNPLRSARACSSGLPAPLDHIHGPKPSDVCSSLTGCSGWIIADTSWNFFPLRVSLSFSPPRVMSFGTIAKTGFSVRDILDLPSPTGKCGSEAKETEEASAEASGTENAQKLGFSGRSFCERGSGSCGRWSRGSGNLHFSCEESFLIFF